MEIHNPNAIIHLDADAFFASCEQVTNPKYKGKPVITGKERGIVSAASYEAKAMGVERGVPLWKVKEICPEAIILPSDYETYSLFSKRIFSIMRRFTPDLEEYSIDEAFADITGLRRPLGMSYPEIVLKIKETVERELGLTVSVGLSVNKVLAKVASKWEKPSGFTEVSLGRALFYLSQLEAGKIWGIGPQTSNFLAKNYVYTAKQFAEKSFSWVKNNLTKPHQEIWQELNGNTVYNVEKEESSHKTSIRKYKTFTPPRKDKNFVFSQLSKNIENSFIKARRHGLFTDKIIISLRDKDFKSYAIEGKLNRATAFPGDVMSIAYKMFLDIYKKDTYYRRSGVTLLNLSSSQSSQMNLFESPVVLIKKKKISEAIDRLSAKYGKHTLHYGSSLLANKERAHFSERGDVSDKVKAREDNIYSRKFINLPYAGSVK